MACDHRYKVTADSTGKGIIRCSRCHDIRQDGLTLSAEQDVVIRQIQDREAEKRRGRIIVPVNRIVH